MERLHYLETGSTDPAYNLAFEEYVLTHRMDGDYLILWQNDNTVVVGQNQNTAAEINRAFVEEHHINVVRRGTGGGAVYHDLGNLNYSFINDVGDDGISIRRFTQPVVAALRSLGLNAEASGRNDILVEGRKVSGTAQRVYKTRILHHGTLLFDSDPDMVAGALNVDPEKFRSKGRKSVRSRIGNIRSFLKQDMTLQDFWAHLRVSLGKTDVAPEQLTAAYREMLRTASIELIVLGCDDAQTAAIRDALLAELTAIDRAPLPLVENMATPRQEPVHKTETFDMVQAKLCMLFTLGQPMQPQQLAAVRLAMALYGGSVTSRLFLNVRERDHLCYYCSASFQSFTGSMAVNSGVEHADAARAEQAILKELADLCDGPITDEELEDCRRGLLSGMNGVEDSLGGMETWYYIEVLRAGANSAAPIQTPAQARAALQAVTKEDVRSILRQLTLSVSYLLTKEEPTHA